MGLCCSFYGRKASRPRYDARKKKEKNMKAKKISKKLNLKKINIADLQRVNAGGTIPFTEWVESQCSENTRCYSQRSDCYMCRVDD
jgi:hypothetical protein